MKYRTAQGLLQELPQDEMNRLYKMLGYEASCSSEPSKRLQRKKKLLAFLQVKMKPNQKAGVITPKK